jgi:hypothetical protein
MKAPYASSTVSDRVSTREELCQVLEVLSAASSARLEKISAAEEESSFAAPEQAGEDHAAELTTAEEFALIADIEPLSEWFIGKRLQIN